MLCAVEGCGREVYKTIYCNPHYIKNRRYGNPLEKRQRNKGEVSRIIKKEGHALVELTQGKWAIIDLDDVERVGQYAWSFISSGYAYSHQAGLLLHQFLIGRAPQGYETDHTNRIKLDCRKENLSHVTFFENNVNSDINASGNFCTYDTVRKKWKATFKRNGKTYYSGYHPTQEEARAASIATMQQLNAESE